MKFFQNRLPTVETSTKQYIVYKDIAFTEDITLEVMKDLGTSISQGFIINDGGNTFEIAFKQEEGKTFGMTFPIYAGENFNLSGMNIIAIRIIHSNNSKYRCMVT